MSLYEETPDTLERKVEEIRRRKELEVKLESLRKKKDIMKNSRISMKKSYEIEIEKQHKYILQLKDSIQEMENVLSSL